MNHEAIRKGMIHNITDTETFQENQAERKAKRTLGRIQMKFLTET